MITHCAACDELCESTQAHLGETALCLTCAATGAHLDVRSGETSEWGLDGPWALLEDLT